MHQLKRLTEKHQHIMGLALDGLTRTEIAHEVGMTPEGVGNVLNSDVFQHQLARRRDGIEKSVDEQRITERQTAETVLTRHATQAAQTQVDLMQRGSEKVRQVAAMDILDRAGYPKITKQQSSNQNVNINVSSELIERMNQASQECFGEPMKFRPEEYANGEDES
ncbi:MAG: hypothetical protein Unbinned400contig1000_9 [Prokaryotic dsDNA virus sp.]|nr:MAG: hypothetical protein Unbinned400contig1000_9 [Prokaryotic dsDNA virus sp.]|tara:strand:+ start:976 stop:1470 length:495 start_codon:yes stop_codon:yes gene_type:complete